MLGTKLKCQVLCWPDACPDLTPSPAPGYTPSPPLARQPSEGGPQGSVCRRHLSTWGITLFLPDQVPNRRPASLHPRGPPGRQPPHKPPTHPGASVRGVALCSQTKAPRLLTSPVDIIFDALFPPVQVSLMFSLHSQTLRVSQSWAAAPAVRRFLSPLF